MLRDLQILKTRADHYGLQEAPIPHLCPAAILRRSQALVGACLFWICFMYLFWRMGCYLPGVPEPSEGLFRVKQVGGSGLNRVRAQVQSECVEGMGLSYQQCCCAPSLCANPIALCVATSPSEHSMFFLSYMPPNFHVEGHISSAQQPSQERNLLTVQHSIFSPASHHLMLGVNSAQKIRSSPCHASHVCRLSADWEC